MIRKRVVAPSLLLLTALVSGCGLLEPGGPVEVRVENGSSLTFDEGVLYLYHDSITFTDLQPGETTPYQETGRAYRIATSRVVTGSDTSGLQVIDFVGEEPLKPGRYTFRLFFFEGDPTSLVQELIRDR